MKKEIKESARVVRFIHPIFKVMGEGTEGCFFVKYNLGRPPLRVISSGQNEGDWEHVSVSCANGRMPSWDEMNFIKDLFFRDDETVIQFHPKKTEYINIATNCLHLWKPPYVVGLPPRDYV